MKLDVKIITGPTCSGKTQAAIDYANRFGAEIISCDSVQVYRGMDIGSAKPSKSQLAQTKHYLIDVAEPSRRFDVSQYVEMAQEAITEIVGRGAKIVVSGGSGFYLKAWFSAVTDNLKIPDGIKEISESIEKDGGVEALSGALLKLDPLAGKFVDLKNPRRTKKALERCMASGKSVGELLAEFKKLPCPFGELNRDVEILDAENSTLLRRIEARAKSMIDEGLVDETRTLISNGILKNESARSAIGYRETIDWIMRGEKNTECLRQTIVANTFALAKKQRKYFRNSLR